MVNEISNTPNIDKLFLDVKQIIEEGRKQGADAINAVICMTNWKLVDASFWKNSMGKHVLNMVRGLSIICLKD